VTTEKKGGEEVQKGKTKKTRRTFLALIFPEEEKEREKLLGLGEKGQNARWGEKALSPHMEKGRGGGNGLRGNGGGFGGELGVEKKKKKAAGGELRTSKREESKRRGERESTTTYHFQGRRREEKRKRKSSFWGKERGARKSCCRDRGGGGGGGVGEGVRV